MVIGCHDSQHVHYLKISLKCSGSSTWTNKRPQPITATTMCEPLKQQISNTRLKTNKVHTSSTNHDTGHLEKKTWQENHSYQRWRYPKIVCFKKSFYLYRTDGFFERKRVLLTSRKRASRHDTQN